jgi:2-methylisocitrate lyase-like PEP mutase family enzyme
MVVEIELFSPIPIHTVRGYSMTTQTEQATLFSSLHLPGDPLILYNIWDAGSAKALEEVGAKAIATGSKPVALANGYEDGEKIPLELVVANAERIVRSVSVPVSIDFESGYGTTPEAVQSSVAQIIAAGAVGINFEDQIVGGTGLYAIDAQVARIAAVRHAAEQAGIPLFINARTDIFLKTKTADHSDEHLAQAIERATAYAEAGANGFFAPGLANAAYIATLCHQSPLPVNIIIFPHTPTPRELAELGVARISYGPAPYNAMINALKVVAQAALRLEK